jgi:hypothetical protein
VIKIEVLASVAEAAYIVPSISLELVDPCLTALWTNSTYDLPGVNLDFDGE